MRPITDFQIHIVETGSSTWAIAALLAPWSVGTNEFIPWFNRFAALNGYPTALYPGQALFVDPTAFPPKPEVGATPVTPPVVVPPIEEPPVVVPPVVTPPVNSDTRDGWNLTHNIDFEKNDGFELRKEAQSNDESYNLPENVSFGSDGLTLLCKRQDYKGLKYTTADVLAKHKTVGNYFRSEMACTLPTEEGQWPGLWFRPSNHADGEIDLVEIWPSFWNGVPVMHSTLHSEYGATHKQEGAKLLYSKLPNPDPKAEHMWMVEKTEGRIRFECDGVLIYEWNRKNFNPTLKGWWDRIFEDPAKRWYPRYTTQMGGKHAGEPKPDWTQSIMKVRYCKVWEPK